MKLYPAINRSLSHPSKPQILTVALAALALTSVSSPNLHAAGTGTYTITDIGRIPVVNDQYGDQVLSYGNVFPTAINDQGQVVGSVDAYSYYFDMVFGISSVRHPWLWENGVITDLEPLDASGYPAYFGFAYGINNAGTVVGTTSIDNRQVAVVWQNDVKTVLDPSEAQSSGGYAINELGHVAGYSAGRSVIWGDGLKSDLGLTEFLRASGINDADQVCGGLSNANGFYGSAIWQNGIVTPITPLGSDAGVSWADAYDINAAGNVVGESSYSDNNYHAFLWRNGTTIDLGVLGVSTNTYTEGVAAAINDFDQVVGGSTTADGNNHGFLWQDGNGNGASDPGEMVDLNTLLPASSGWEIISASGINNSGQIVGIGLFAGTDLHAFVMTPPLTAPQQVQALQSTVQALVVVQGAFITQSLTLQLTAVELSLAAGNVPPAINQLGSMILRVQAFVKGGKLTAAQGQELIDAAQAIITTLGN